MEWRNEIQAVAFQPHGHGAPCMIHRLAIRTLMGRTLVVGTSPSPQDCLAFAEAHADVLQAAATHKIRAQNIPTDRSLHLTSRDVRRRQIGSSQ